MITPREIPREQCYLSIRVLLSYCYHYAHDYSRRELDILELGIREIPREQCYLMLSIRVLLSYYYHCVHN